MEVSVGGEVDIVEDGEVVARIVTGMVTGDVAELEGGQP